MWNQQPDQGHRKLHLDCDETGSTQKECEMDWRAANQRIYAPYYPNGVHGVWLCPSSKFSEGREEGSNQSMRIGGDCIAAAESGT
jgi:hypothetical protein